MSSGRLTTELLDNGLGLIEAFDNPTPVNTTKPPTTVQRASLTVTVGFDAEDSALVLKAGLGLTGFTVRIQRLGSPDPVRTVAVPDGGVVTVDSLLEGRYAISAERLLTSTELARLSPSEQFASVFAGGSEAVLSPPVSTQASVALVAARRGSLVISEIFAYRPGPPVFYGFGTYFEVYNNADTTIYLDGILFARTSSTIHTDIWGDCSFNAALRTDTTAMWVSLVHRFPGTGFEYPIQPGTAKVIAMDAMNHAQASPETQQVDLSNADLEENGSEADLEPATLTRQHDGLTSVVYRIPASSVLDVVSIDVAPAVKARLDALGAVVNACSPWIAPIFDRAVAPLLDYVDPRAIARKSLGRTSDGREIVQRTRTSTRDFIYTAPLRRSLRR